MYMTDDFSVARGVGRTGLISFVKDGQINIRLFLFFVSCFLF